MSRRWLAPEAAADLGRLDPEAIARVRAEAWPDAANADELHDALVWLGFLTADEARAGAGWSDWLAELARQKRVAQLACAGSDAVDRRRAPAAVPGALARARRSSPRSPRRPPHAGRAWSRDEALVEIVRGRLEGPGAGRRSARSPLRSASRRATSRPRSRRSRPKASPCAAASRRQRQREEWCERRLLARIHRLHGQAAARGDRAGRGARLPALPARLAARRGRRAHGRAGRPRRRRRRSSKASRRRPAPGRARSCRRASPTTSRPGSTIAASPGASPGRGCGPRNGRGERRRAQRRRRCAPRRSRCWRAATPRTGRRCRPVPRRGPSRRPRASGRRLHPRARRVVLRRAGRRHRPAALRRSRRRSPSWSRSGLVTSDSFGGLRALLVPSDRAPADRGGRRRRRTVAFGMEDAGRWALARRVPPAPASGSGRARRRSSTWRARLLRRYGVVFWRLLEREAAWLPPWRDLLRVYRRLESRGEIRGGRFVAGFSGEQFALPEAVGMLREVAAAARLRRAGSRCPAPTRSTSSASSRPGRSSPALTGNRLLYRDGLPIALLAGRRGAVSRDARRRERMGGAQGSAARRAAGAVHRFAYQSG